MLVWRLEDERGNGPYCGNIGSIAHLKMGWDEMLHPWPGLDPGIGWGKWNLLAQEGGDLRFGFASIEQYLRWFHCPDGRASLAANGIQLVQYEVSDEDVILGAAQVIFLRDRSKKVKSISPELAALPGQSAQLETVA